VGVRGSIPCAPTWRMKGYEVMISVPATASMDDETLTKHLNLRHVRRDYADLLRLGGGAQSTQDRSVRETYHRYCHEMGEYDHVHQEA
jgi:hypothetical protein